MQLKLWWKLDDASKADGAVAADSSGFGNDGTYDFGACAVCAVHILQGVTGHDSVANGAVEVGITPTFGGGEDAVGEADVHVANADLDFDVAFQGQAAFQCEAWLNVPIKCADQQTRGLLGASNGNNPLPSAPKSWGWKMDFTNGSGGGTGPAYLTFFRGDWDGLAPGHARDDLQITSFDFAGAGWTKVKTVYDGTDMSVYISDVLVGTLASSLLLGPVQGFWVGGTAFGIVGGSRTFAYAPTEFNTQAPDFLDKGTYFDDVKIWTAEEGPCTIRSRFGSTPAS